MLLYEDQIEKAQSRASFDLAAAIAAMQDKTPGEFPQDLRAQAARNTFLRETHDRPRDATKVFERILQGNELQPVNYLERGAIAARAIARIDIRTPGDGRVGWGTGFLIAPNVLITNNHVLPDADTAAASKAQLSYELDLADQESAPVIFDLDSAALFHTSKTLDFTVVAVAPRSTDGTTSLAPFGHLPLLDVPGKAMEGEWLTIVQHPGGELKQLCVRENRLIKRDDDVLWYSTDTLPGSSGSPVFNNDWFVVALHHSGVPEKEQHGEYKTVDGSRYVSGVTKEIQVKWIANEGIRASRITQTLKSALPQHPLLQPLFNATPASARITRRASGHEPPPLPSSKAPVMSANTNFPLRRCVEISADGNIKVIGDCGTGASESMALEKAKAKRRAANFDAPFDSDYKKRKGYLPDFLGEGAKRVALPKLSDALEAVAVPLLPKTRETNGLKPQDFVLKYDNYSLVMHAKRKMAIYSAANVDFDHRFDMSRPPDKWLTDPRIPDEYQLTNWYYEKNQFDRGHLTRREDLEFGKTRKQALQSAADTCHWTNCTPQHSKFNQNKEIWQGLELYILEATIKEGEYSAQVITGPIFDQEDPDYKGMPYPLQYWKVVAAINDAGKLFATAYIASQEDVIDKYGIEAAVPFGPYKTFQVKIADIERLTGLSFMCGANDAKSLKEHDPLEVNPPSRRRSRRAGETEATVMRDFGRYQEIAEFEDIHLAL